MSPQSVAAPSGERERRLKAGMVLFAGYTVWSMSERLEVEILVIYGAILGFPFPGFQEIFHSREWKSKIPGENGNSKITQNCNVAVYL